MILRRLAALALAGLLASSSPILAQQQPAGPPVPEDVTFRIFVRGQPLGNETVTVMPLADGWKIVSTGQLNAPVAITTRIAEIVYDREWRPKSLFIDAIAKDQPVTVRTSFAGGKATSNIVQGDKPIEKTDAVAERTIVLPNMIFGAYEALAPRLSTAQPGATFRVYVAPQAEIDMKLDAVSVDRVSVPGRTFQARHHTVTFQNPGGPLSADVWTDGERLMRVSIPSASFDVVRSDIATVASRQTTNYRPNDEDVRVASIGFNLAGTLSKPPTLPPPVAGKPARLPAIVLVAGSGPLDRDETVAGVAVFSQLAAALADAGYLVLRYDKRGIGQSGGRAESATLSDYAEDVRAAVKYLESRKDVDKDRIAVVGHSEGAAVGLIAGQRDKKIAALVLVAGPGTTGADLILEQQKHALERAKTPASEQAEKIALQRKIHEAVLTGAGWDGIPEALRKQADSVWFQSLLQFDPGKIVPRVRQPILVVQGELDTQVPPRHADLLAALANARKNRPVTEVVKLPGINHLLVPAKTGEVDEYGSLSSRTITPDVPAKIIEWLGRMTKGRS